MVTTDRVGSLELVIRPKVIEEGKKMQQNKRSIYNTLAAWWTFAAAEKPTAA
ncbi:hypothetical protein SLEP1_g418 [Rubroshorea leprosula]|uniref:Uncharacterized protein n=1 Tax=Rubroshorea leprosula TaxID=152421 RepID=A0AAV5HF63_9ROSI|nr:hypothetical protein SLEP1_g418 [Rubroshorea leprosula]